ncbi:MAG: RNA methyltransferase [Saprospiraceae bacterium]
MTTLPPEFVIQVQELLGAASDNLIEALAATPPVSVHRNPRKSVDLEGITEGVPWYSEGYYLSSRPVFTLDPAFHAGAYYVQEASSMLIAAAFQRCFPEGRPLRVLDLCAAPGGKTTLLASLLPQGSWLLANEVIRSRYQILRYNVAKWGHASVFTSNHDVSQFKGLEGFFDCVLVDAPCSGEGLFRKDPAARDEWSPEHVQFCAARQGRILEEAAPLVAPEGVLLYSTCTYNSYENDSQARWLKEVAGFNHVDLDFPAEWGLMERTYGYQAFPHRVKGEGFYLAAFRREDGDRSVLRKIPPFKKLQLVAAKEEFVALPWVKADTDTVFFTTPTNANWRALRASWMEDARWLSAHLPALEVGTLVGELKGKSLIPAPEWALHEDCNSNLPTVDTDRETALELLRKHTPSLSLPPTGWVLAHYQGLPFAWLKSIGNRYNNYYPVQWRIRMQE